MRQSHEASCRQLRVKSSATQGSRSWSRDAASAHYPAQHCSAGRLSPAPRARPRAGPRLPVTARGPRFTKRHHSACPELPHRAGARLSDALGRAGARRTLEPALQRRPGPQQPAWRGALPLSTLHGPRGAPPLSPNFQAPPDTDSPLLPPLLSGMEAEESLNARVGKSLVSAGTANICHPARRSARAARTLLGAPGSAARPGASSFPRPPPAHCQAPQTPLVGPDTMDCHSPNSSEPPPLAPREPTSATSPNFTR